jgi:mannan endo-1,4-beta-mannosidase
MVSLRISARISCAAVFFSVVAGSASARPFTRGTRDAVPPGFVTRDGTRLLLNGQPYRVSGLNIYNANSNGLCWYAMNGTILDDSLAAIGPGKNAFRAWFFQQLATTNVTRDWTAFDRTLATARARGLKVIATLIDQWGNCGSSVAAGGYKNTDWYRSGYRDPDPAGIVSYRDWVAEVVDRYKDDPTILAWQLVNEPEVLPENGADCATVPESEAARLLKAFAEDISGLIKSIDPNHLVSLGTLGSGQCGTQYTDYEDVHSVATLDLCEYHDYQSSSPMPGDEWNGLQRRLDQCNALGKPILVGELGLRPSDVGGTLRDRANTLDAKLCGEYAAGIAGALEWAWNKDGSTLDNFDVGPGDPVLATLAPWSDPAHACALGVSAKTALASYPAALALNGDTGKLYAAHLVGDVVSVVDAANTSLLKTIAVGNTPYALAVNETTNRVYVANRYGGSLSVIDGDSDEVVATIPLPAPSPSQNDPVAVAVDPQRDLVYVANVTGYRVTVVDGSRNAVVGTIELGFNSQPDGIAVDPARNLVYVAESNYGRLAVIDGSTRSVVSEIPVGVYPAGVAVASSANKIYVANYGSNTISVVDGATRAEVTTIPAGRYTRYVEVLPGLGHLYIPHSQDDFMTVVDTRTYDPIANVPILGGPYGVAADGSTGRVYVTQINGSALSSIQDAQPDLAAPNVSCGSSDGAWHADNVAISCTATDGGSGLANPGDANFVLSTNVPAGTETANGATSSRDVCDQAGNCAQAGPIGGNKVDRRAPDVTCEAPDGAWHAGDVNLACSASDAGSGLANAADAAFSLATSVPDGTETADAATSSRQVCDAVSHCAAAGPIGGNKIDKKPPSVSVAVPAPNANYVFKQPIAASYGCTDGGSGVASCTGTVASGANVPTGLPVGARTFSVTARDGVGRSSTTPVQYNVRFTFQGFFYPRNQPMLNVVQAGRTVPVRFALVDYFGASVYPAVGVNIFVANSPSVGQLACPSATTFNVTQTASAGLRYDSSSGRYEYGFVTSAGWAGTCRTLTLKFRDGTSQKLSFRFR